MTEIFCTFWSNNLIIQHSQKQSVHSAVGVIAPMVPCCSVVKLSRMRTHGDGCNPPIDLGAAAYGQWIWQHCMLIRQLTEVYMYLSDTTTECCLNLWMNGNFFRHSILCSADYIFGRVWYLEWGKFPPNMWTVLLIFECHVDHYRLPLPDVMWKNSGQKYFFF